MKRKLFFITFLMLLCSTIFGQITPKYNYVEDGTYQHSMILTAVIEFDGVEQINPNLELGVFSGNELRGGAFVEEIDGRYYARPVIYGQSGQFFTFKVYDHTTGIEIEREWSVGSTFTYGGSTMEYMSYNSYGYGNFSQPAVIDFVTPNHWIPNHNVYENNYDVIAVVLIDDIEQAGQDAVNLELGAFSVSDGTVRGSVKLNSQTILGNTRYYADMLVYGNENDKITFRLYNHATKQELQFNDVNTCTLIEANDATGNPILGSYIKPVEVNFITEPYVAQIGDKNYTSLEKAIAAAQAGDVVKVFAGTYPLPSMKAGITIEGAVDENGEVKVLFEGTLTGTLEDLTLKNIHIRGGNAQRWAYAKGDLKFVNVIFEATSVYALHFDGITEGTNLLYDHCTIIGWAAMGGTPESCKFIGCTIKDNGTYGVIRTYFDTTIEGCTFDVDGANPNDNFQDGIHAVDGAYVIVNGCTNVNGTMEDIVNILAMSVVSIDGVEIKHLAKIGDNYYFTLAEAFASVQNGETVQLLADLTLVSETTDPETTDPETTYTIADGKSVTLDMNGKKITVTDNKTSSNYELFYIYGGLTVIGDGTIELTATNDRDWNAMSAIFHNRGGVLTINNGTFKHLGGTDMAYVVDNSGNYYGDATTNINNGTLASTYIAIRNRMEQNTHGASGKAILNVANGSISGTSRAIWAQAASTSETAPATGEINISGGNIGLIETDRSTGAVSMTTISGGTVTEFKGEVNELKVTGGTLNGVTIMDASENVIDYAVNKDGLYVAAVAKIGDKGYVSIQAAVNEAQDGNTVIVKEGKYNVFCPVGSDDNYTGLAHNLFVGKSITIKGEEGKEVVIYSYQETYTSTFDARITLLISGSDGVVIDNLTILPCYYPATITTDLSTVTGSEINALVGADNLKYYYNQIIDAMRSYNYNGQVSKDYIANITVKNCTIGDEAIPAENWGSAIYYPGAVGNADNFAGLTGGYTIENNVLFGGICICEGAAKDATTETCIIKNNTIHGGLFLNGKRPTGWNYVSLTVFPTVTGNTFTQAAGNTDGHAWFIGSRDGDAAAVIPTGTLEAYLANNTFTVASDKKAKVVVGNYAYSAEATEYYGLVSSEFIVDGEGTENNPYIITNLHELEAFRDAVNAGNNFSGKVFKLNGGINLDVTRAINNWEPIGTQANPFMGTFDGGDNTISNLVVEGENNVGLFGYATSATIKNVKLENVNVKGTDCVGAIAGQVYSTSLIDNCHVSGLIQVEGQTNVGGIVGKYYTKVKNCSVIGDGVATSYVKGTHVASDLEGDNIGGIMGHGGEDNRFENNTVKNITISGTRKVAGIVGVTDMNTQVKNCVVEDVNIVTTATVEYANSKKNTMSNGTLVGSYTTGNNTTGTVESCVVKNVKFLNPNNAVVSVGPITGGLRGGTDGMLAPTGVAASNNNIYMSTITGSNNLFLMNPVAKIGTTEYYTLFDAVAAVQDGETITMLRNTAEEFAIDNTTANITLDMAGFTLTGAITPSKANLTIENGTINNENASYSAIEINAGTLVLNDVTVTSKRHGVRIDGAVTATINGGEYRLSATSGTRHAVNVSGGADVTIKAGTFVGPAGTSMDSGSAVCVQSGAKVTIEGGDFSGGKNATLGVSGTMIVKGGTFDQVVNALYLADGYVCQMNADNKYEVFFAVASITNANGTLYYASLQAAVNAAGQNETTIVMIADAEVSQTVRVEAGQKITLDLNGKTISAGWEDQSAGKHIYAFTNNGTLTINDSSTEANGVINARGNFNYGTLTLEKGTINAIDDNGGYGVRNYDGATFTMNGGTIAATNEDGDTPGNGYDATTVRVDEGAIFTMNGGTINNSCNYTFAIENHGTTTIEGGTITSVHSTVANYGTMTIEGGSFTCNGLEGITAHALWAAAGTTTINGGTFDGKDNYNGFNVDASEGAIVNITGGNFLPVHSGSLYGEGTIAVSGGTFFDPVPEARCAAGYIPQNNGDGTYGVKLGQYVAQVGDVKYESLQEAVEAVSATDNEIIILANSAESVSVPADVIINLNEIETEADITAGGNLTFKGNGSIKALNSIVGGTITVENGKTLALNNFSFGSSGNASATYTITGGTITANYGFFQHGVYALYSNFETGYMYYSFGSDITVYGTLHSEGEGDGLDYVRGKLTIANGGKSMHDKALWVGRPASWGPMEATLIVEQGGYVKANSLSVYSGSALQIDATGLTGGETIDEVECNALTVEGTVEAINNDKVMAVVEGNKIIIKAKPVMIVETDAYYATLAEAFAAANNQTVKVLQNITLTETVTIEADKTVTLDLNGKTISAEATFAVKAIVNNGTLTINGNGGTIDISASTTESIQVVDNYGTLTINGGTYKGASSNFSYAIRANHENSVTNIVSATITTYFGAVGINKGVTTITDGKFEVTSEAGGHALYVANAEVTINGGEFIPYANGYSYAVLTNDANAKVSITGGTFKKGLGDPCVKALSGNIILTGGTFSTDVNAYCHENYAAILGADNLWRVEQVIFVMETALANGWNWFSAYVDIDGADGLASIKESLGENGLMVKDGETGKYIQYTASAGTWNGTLTETSSVGMYMIRTSDTIDEFIVEGSAKLDPSDEEMTMVISKGWNYIPYPLDVPQSITTALGFTPQNGDVIKRKAGGDAIYQVGQGGQGWRNAFDMEPGQGYMYKSNATSTIRFNYSYPTGGAKSSMLANVETIDYHWTVDAHKYANSMNMIAMVNVDGEMVKGGYEVAAFSNEGECRGTARPFYVEDMDAYLMILTIHGEEVENLTFRYYDIDTDTEYELNNVVTYSDNAVIGTIDEPYILTMDIMSIGEMSAEELFIYPNPTTIGREINLNATFDKVEVYNALGVKVVEYQNVDAIDALETAGIYVIRVTDNNGDVKHCRLVVK